jgi:hypothetical protein
MTYRQLDYWTRRGWLQPHNGHTPGSGHPRQWDESELWVAVIIGRLRLAGIEMDTAVRVARCRVSVPYEVTLADGVVVRVDPSRIALPVLRGEVPAAELDPSGSGRCVEGPEGATKRNLDSVPGE